MEITPNTQTIRKTWQAYADNAANGTWTTRHIALTSAGPRTVAQLWMELNAYSNQACDIMYVIYTRDNDLGSLDWTDVAVWSKYRDRVWAYGLGVAATIPFRELIEPKTSRTLTEVETLYLFIAERSFSGSAATISRQSFAGTFIEVT